MATSSNPWTCPVCAESFERADQESIVTGEVWAIARLGMCTRCAVQIIEMERFPRP